MLQCHVWQFTEDVLFLKQHENKSAKNPQEFISKADGIKALVLHVEEGRGGRISTFRSWEKSLSFSSEGKFNKNIHCCEGGTFRSICWAIEAHCDAQSWDVSTAFPGTVGCFLRTKEAAFIFSRVFSQKIQIQVQLLLSAQAFPNNVSLEKGNESSSCFGSF